MMVALTTVIVMQVEMLGLWIFWDCGYIFDFLADWVEDMRGKKYCNYSVTGQSKQKDGVAITEMEQVLEEKSGALGFFCC